jgi:phosphocarrier protein HPr
MSILESEKEIMSKINVTFRNPGDVLEFVRRVEKYPYDMDLSRGSIVVDAKSLLGIMNLGFNQVVSLKVYSEECSQLQQDILEFIAA